MAAAAIARAENFIFVGDCLNLNREDNEGEGMTTDFVAGWLGSCNQHTEESRLEFKMVWY